MTARLVARRYWRAFRSGASGQVDLISPHYFRLMTIAEQNDAFRQSFAGGQVCVTRGISALPQDAQTAIAERVRSFEEFDEESDPWGEHDFGSFEYSGQTIFWKVDCYDTKLEWGSPDPANLAVTSRVLTILLAEEY